MVKGIETAVSNGLPKEGHNSEKQQYCLTYLIYQACYCVGHLGHKQLYTILQNAQHNKLIN